MSLQVSVKNLSRRYNAAAL